MQTQTPQQTAKAGTSKLAARSTHQTSDQMHSMVEFDNDARSRCTRNSSRGLPSDHGSGGAWEGFSLLGRERSPEGGRNCTGRNRQITRKSGQNGNVSYRVGLAAQHRFWRSSAGGKAGVAPKGSRRCWLSDDDSRRNGRVSGPARAGLGKCQPFTQPVVHADRRAAGGCISVLHHTATAEFDRSRPAQERSVGGRERKARKAGMGPVVSYARHGVYSSSAHASYFLRTRTSSFAIAKTCFTSVGISPIGMLPISAPFWPVLCSKIDGLGTKVGLAVSFFGGFFSSELISFLIESVASPMMEGAGVLGNGHSSAAGGIAA